MKRNIKCDFCTKEVETYKSSSRFCSLRCNALWHHKNKPFSKFVKNHKTRVGMQHTEDFKTKRKTSGNPYWKGSKATVSSKHDWIRRNFIKSGFCEHCAYAKKTEWSNKHHTYTRMREDWQELCRSCHQKYDYSKGLRIHYSYQQALLQK